MKLNKYGISQYAKNPYPLDALDTIEWMDGFEMACAIRKVLFYDTRVKFQHYFGGYSIFIEERKWNNKR